jgi:malate/lactate dehydrogenase
MKVVIVGVGKVGSTVAYSMLHRKDVTEIVLVDSNAEKLRGEHIDLKQASHVLRSENIVHMWPDHLDVLDPEYVAVISAGHPRSPGETDDVLFEKNFKAVESIVSLLKAKQVFILTNPSEKIVKILQNNNPLKTIIPLGQLHRHHGDCSKILETKKYTNWGIAAEAEVVVVG